MDITRITVNVDVIERVFFVTLLGCHLMANLSSEEHIASLVTKASRLFHLLSELKRTGWSANALLTCYFSFARSKTEFACEVWSTALTSEQSHTIEIIQRRAMHITPPHTRRTKRPRFEFGNRWVMSIADKSS